MPEHWRASGITVRGVRIAVGDTFDHALTVLKSEDRIAPPDKAPDPDKPGSLVVAQHYRVDGVIFDLVMARDVDPGPYVIGFIILRQDTEGLDLAPPSQWANRPEDMNALDRLARSIELAREAESIGQRLGALQTEGRQLAARLLQIQAEMERLKGESEAYISRQQKRAAQRAAKKPRKGVH